MTAEISYEPLPVLLKGDIAARIGNEHRASAALVQDVARAVHALLSADPMSALVDAENAVRRRERERIADLWVGCFTEAEGHGEVDIGASIRAGRLVDAVEADAQIDRKIAAHCRS